MRAGAEYPYEELDDLWQQVLLHQFHDILPGTSIAWVHREAEAAYGRIHERLQELIAQAAETLGGEAEPGISVLNAAAHDRREVVFLNTEPEAEAAHQVLADGRVAAIGDAPALGIGALLSEFDSVVSVSPADGGYRLTNGLIEAHIDSDGLLRSVRDLALGRDAIAPGGAGNLLQLHRDQPNLWPAWNLERHYRNVRTNLTEGATVTLVDAGPLVATVRVERSFGESHLVQDIGLGAGSRRLDVDTDIDWRERDTVLKSAWQLDVHAERTAAEIQFGHVCRPTHENTSWDAARFEVYAHRWIHVGRARLGHRADHRLDLRLRCFASDPAGGGSTTTVRLTLLRAPNSPDPQADLGRHRFAYATRPRCRHPRGLGRGARAQPAAARDDGDGNEGSSGGGRQRQRATAGHASTTPTWSWNA